MAYSIIVSNVGAGPTVGTITVVETPPAGMGSCGMRGDGWACNPATFTCTRSDVLAPGSSYPAITVTADIDGDAPTLIVNSATVFGSGASGGITANDPTAVDPQSSQPVDVPVMDWTGTVLLIILSGLGGIYCLRRS